MYKLTGGGGGGAVLGVKCIPQSPCAITLCSFSCVLPSSHSRIFEQCLLLQHWLQTLPSLHQMMACHQLSINLSLLVYSNEQYLSIKRHKMIEASP